MTVLFKKLNEKAVMPIRTENSGAGFDLTAVNVTTNINSRGQVVIVYHSGIGIDVPEDYEAVLRPANDISTRTIRMCNPQRVLNGKIDDEIVAEFMTTTDVVPQVYNSGEVFAQLVFNKKESVDWAEIEMEASAGEGDQSPLEKEGEPTNSEDAEAPSGGEENVPEQA